MLGSVRLANFAPNSFTGSLSELTGLWVTSIIIGFVLQGPRMDEMKTLIPGTDSEMLQRCAHDAKQIVNL
jgi:hypothetical protein